MIDKRILIAVTLLLLVASTSAHAFRCGRKIVEQDMHEIEVIRACGQPTTSRSLGFALRGTYIPIQRHTAGGLAHHRFPGYGTYTQEVELVEYVYNFGPRRLMRRLLFEGGVLVRIESLGYGYRDDDGK